MNIFIMWIKILMVGIAVLSIVVRHTACIELVAPKLESVEAIEPAKLYVKWASIVQSLADPIFGYKIRIYEIPESSEVEFQLINAEEYPGMVRTDEGLEKFSKDSTIPVTREANVDRNATSATIDGIKYNTLYEVRVLAFKGIEDGPLSEPIRIKVLKDTEYRAVVTRTLEGCHYSVAQEVTAAGETYPYVYNAYF